MYLSWPSYCLLRPLRTRALKKQNGLASFCHATWYALTLLFTYLANSPSFTVIVFLLSNFLQVSQALALYGRLEEALDHLIVQHAEGDVLLVCKTSYFLRFSFCLIYSALIHLGLDTGAPNMHDKFWFYSYLDTRAGLVFSTYNFVKKHMIGTFAPF